MNILDEKTADKNNFTFSKPEKYSCDMINASFGSKSDKVCNLYIFYIINSIGSYFTLRNNIGLVTPRLKIIQATKSVMYLFSIFQSDLETNRVCLSA